MNASEPPRPRVVGRYALYDEIASGGMATVHYGRLLGPVGFSRTVAIKRLHPQFAKDPDFAAMFLDEARLVSRIHHPNVVQTLDVVALEGELFLVMDYVMGESLSRLLRDSQARNQTVPLPIASAILCGVLHGLHAAHEATNDRGEPLGIVHRDVSPQNVIVGSDGVPRVIDFGVAMAAGRSHTTREGQLKGKLLYMAPEQLDSGPVDRRTDVYAAGVVLWEILTLQRLFTADSEGGVIRAVFDRHVDPPSAVVPGIPPALDAICLRALERDPRKRFDSARQMALAMEQILPVASATQTAAWIEPLAEETLSRRSRAVASIESQSDGGEPGPRDAPPVDAAQAGDGAPTQVSGISISTDVRRARGARTPLWGRIALTAGAVGFIAVGAGALGIRWERANREIPRPEVTPATSVATPPSPAVTAPSAAAPSEQRPSPPTTAEEILTPAPPTASAHRAPPTSRPRPSPGLAKTCGIRSFIDDAGIKTFVEDCK